MSEQHPTRGDYAYLHPITTRWHDNDVYGHINNVVYYTFFDSAVNSWLINEGGLDIHQGEQVAFVVSSACDYFQPTAYPEQIEIGVRVAKLGNSSVHYELAVFSAGNQQARAAGRFVHVFVERSSNRACPIPAGPRAALERLQLND